MHTLLLLSLFSQAPITTAPPAPGTAPWVQRQLMNMDWLPNQGPVVRVEGRVLRIQDDDFAQSFELVPEAQKLATSARASYETGTRWLTTSTVTLAVGASVLLTGALFGPLITSGSSTRSLAPPLLMMGGGLVTMLSALVLTLVSLPHLQRAQNDFFGAIATYNRGLLDVRPPILVVP